MDDLRRRVDKLEHSISELKTALEKHATSSDLRIAQLEIEKKVSSDIANLQDYLKTTGDYQHKELKQSLEKMENKFNEIPSKGDFKELILDMKGQLNLASKTDVSDSVGKLHIKLVLWIIATMITVSGIASGILIRILK
ncbi:hypothetical protein E6C60_2027 [Paenibacillus algicola]|uniref:Uncharacterized protein n=2 Tax=Paenibacillus algicola TaxID=2565926 RepID=A0A4P8XJC4_9BACL|nr:hypothetical protein E6C60_2027 [Paenibacillus algicola]